MVAVRTAILWYENDEGEPWVPTQEDLANGCEDRPDGFIYQHSRWTNQLTHTCLRGVMAEEVAECEHSVEYIKMTGGWIEGIRGRECMACKGTQSCEENSKWRRAIARAFRRIAARVIGWIDPWPKVWDAHGARELFAGSDTYSQDLVEAMIRDGCGFDEAVLRASGCERCMNALAHEFGLGWGYPRGGEEWAKTNTSCAWCEEEKAA